AGDISCRGAWISNYSNPADRFGFGSRAFRCSRARASGYSSESHRALQLDRAKRLTGATEYVSPMATVFDRFWTVSRLLTARFCATWSAGSYRSTCNVCCFFLCRWGKLESASHSESGGVVRNRSSDYKVRTRISGVLHHDEQPDS